MSEDKEEFEVAGQIIRLAADEAALVVYAPSRLRGSPVTASKTDPRFYATANFVERGGFCVATFPKIKLKQGRSDADLEVTVFGYTSLGDSRESHITVYADRKS